MFINIIYTYIIYNVVFRGSAVVKSVYVEYLLELSKHYKARFSYLKSSLYRTFIQAQRTDRIKC